jgi:predicted Ser/Thr protein kinase
MGKKNKKNIEFESYQELEKKAVKLEASLRKIAGELRHLDAYDNITFNEFLYFASKEPELIFRDVFMYFHDMINYYVPEGEDDFEVSSESVGFVKYNFDGLFVENCTDPFFADRLFANRFMNLVNAFSKGVQNNQIILFEGPPGSGKSTFLNNLLNKFEAYSKTQEGIFYTSLWRLDTRVFEGYNILLDKNIEINPEQNSQFTPGPEYVNIPCPNNDHPILQIPLEHRQKFLDELITDNELKDKLFNSKEYGWVFKEKACSICSSVYNALLEKTGDPIEVLNMLYAKRLRFSRQFGKGISVYNPGDEIIKGSLTDRTIQQQINNLFHSEIIKYIFSPLAYTNNGIYALMDIKDNNIARLNNLHGIISDGIHKVGQAEERIKSMFFGLVNPEDKKHYENVKSFQDRIIHVNIPYILDYEAEVSVYRNKFDTELDKLFLPRVLNNFAKIIISTRLEPESPTIKAWLKNTSRYEKFNDKNFLLLKMALYKGKVPKWLYEDDISGFTKPVRKALIAESEAEGKKGFSGRYSVSVFNKLITKFSDNGKLITMVDVISFFIENSKLKEAIPDGFMKSLEDLYDYNVLQEIKESIFFYSEKQIQNDILNYLFAINYDEGETVKNFYTEKKVEVNEDLFKNFEKTILGHDITDIKRKEFRELARKEYITQTLAGEIKLQGIEITKTAQYQSLFEKYIRNIKESALANYIDNETFRRAVKEYKSQAFNKHTDKLKSDVNRLIERLVKNCNYTEKGAVQVILYAFDKKIYEKF